LLHQQGLPEQFAGARQIAIMQGPMASCSAFCACSTAIGWRAGALPQAESTSSNTAKVQLPVSKKRSFRLIMAIHSDQALLGGCIMFLSGQLVLAESIKLRVSLASHAPHHQAA